MTKIKKTVSFDIPIYNKLEKLQFKLKIKEFSNLVNYICRLHTSNPKEIARTKAREHMSKFQMYKEIVDSIEALEEECSQEETETEKIYRESVEKIENKNQS